MKKFTNLEEELLKENAEVANQFNTKQNEIFQKLDQIKVGVDDMATKLENEPRNWGYVGNVGHINDQLDQILIFLGLKEDE